MGKVLNSFLLNLEIFFYRCKDFQDFFPSFKQTKTKLFFLIRYGHDEDYPGSLLERDFATIRYPWKVKQIQELMPILS